MFCAIFDMDGTIIDTQRIYVEAWEIAGKNQGIEGLGSLVKYVCGLKHEDSIAFAKSHHPELDCKRFFDEYFPYAQKNKNVALLPGAAELLDFLYENDVPMAIASSSPMDEILENLEKLNIKKYFRVLTSGYEVAHGKPAPDVFLLAAEKLGMAPDQCFVFEDAPNGVRAAYSAGMRCFGIPDVAIFNDEIVEKSFRIISSIDKAIPILKEFIDNGCN